MSVINQMLRDLDERQASERERAGLPNRLRTLPTATARGGQSWRLLALGVGIGVGLAGAGAFLLLPRENASPPAPAESAPVVAAPIIAAPVAAAPAAMETILPVPVVPQVIDVESPTLVATSKPPVPSKRFAAAAQPADGAAAPAAVASPPPARAVTESPQDEGATAGRIERSARGPEGRAAAEAAYRQGMQAVRRGEAQAALPALRKAIEFDPAMSQARQALLSVLVSQRQWPEAQQVARQGLELDARQTGWAVILARLQFEQGDAAAAVTTLENYAVHAGADADYQSLFAYLLQEQQRPAEAAQRFQTALALRPNEGRWWFGLATAHEALGRTEEARGAYARARASGNLPADMLTLAEQKLR